MYFDPATFSFSTVSGQRKVSVAGGFTGFANPSASVGLTAVNGVATTAMRSDAAPALSQAITPTWTGKHVWSGVGINVGTELRVGSTSDPTITTTGWVTAVGLRLTDGALTESLITKALVTDTINSAIISGAASLPPSLNRMVSVELVSTPATNAAAIDRSTSSLYAWHDVQVSGNSNSIGGNYAAMSFDVNRSTGGTGGLATLYGIQGQVLHDISATTTAATGIRAFTNISSGTITTARGLHVLQTLGSGTLTTGIGVDVERTRSAGTFSTSIGLRVNAAVGTIGTDIAIQSLGGENRFVGNVMIGANSSPSVALDVTGVVKASTGFRQGTVTAGNVLRGDGTNFVSSAIQDTDLATAFGAGTSWTPTITPDAGSFTTVTGSGHYKQVGKYLYFNLIITQTNVGTGTGLVNFSLPNSLSQRDGGATAAGRASAGYSLYVNIGSTTVALGKYDGSSPISNGNYLVVTGYIEVN